MRLFSKAAVADSDLGVLRLDATKSRSLSVGEIIHCGLGEVEAVVGMVDSKNVHRLAVVCDAVACTALRAVPAGNAYISADTWETGDGTLIGPAVLGDQTVGTV